jgi:predicted GNAT superfamily acetyltransferase
MPAEHTMTESIEAARSVATEASRTANVAVKDLHDHAQMVQVSQLFDAVWGRQEGAVLVPEAMVAFAHAGGQVSAAYRHGELVGATAAFLGRTTDGRPFLHSHVTGVRTDQIGTGIGAALKWHQRAWCLERGIDEVQWTFDPLIRRNVVFNLVRLGAQAVDYLDDVYGRMPDARNAGLPSDRFVATWNLMSPRVVSAAAGRSATPDVAALRRGGAAVALEAQPDGAPRRLFVETPRQLVQLPPDIEQLRATDPDRAMAWAEAVRSAVGEQLRAGARISGATRDGWLVLSTAGEGVEELTAPGAAR